MEWEKKLVEELGKASRSEERNEFELEVQVGKHYDVWIVTADGKTRKVKAIGYNNAKLKPVDAPVSVRRYIRQLQRDVGKRGTGRIFTADQVVENFEPLEEVDVEIACAFWIEEALVTKKWTKKN